jgi:hypothetical protein
MVRQIGIANIAQVMVEKDKPVSMSIDYLRKMVIDNDSTIDGLPTLGYENWFAIDALKGDVWIVPVKDILDSYNSHTEDRLITLSYTTFPIYDNEEYAGIGSVYSDTLGESEEDMEKEGYGDRDMPDMSKYKKVEIVWSE